MPNYYTGRESLKKALGIGGATAGTATADNGILENVLETVSRLIDDYVGYHFYEASGTRYFTPTNTTHLRLN